MKPTYDFDTQKALGKQGERILDRLLAQWYDIEQLPLDIERQAGADRLFIRPDGSQVLVEYKTDYMAHETGNLVIETVSVDTFGVDGWAVSSHAEMLVTLVYYLGLVLVVEMDTLRAKLSEWSEKYRKVAIKNDGYSTIGLVVPLEVYKDITIAQLHTTVD